MRISLAVALLTSLVAPTSGCPGAQVKNNSGEVEVVLRRIDVVEADFDKMKLHVIVAVENGTGDDVSAQAEASLAIVGEAPADGADTTDTPAAEGDAEAGADADGDAPATDGDAPAEAAGGATPVDGKRHAGRGGGKAAAFNTSELPIVVELPLPSDPALLEQVLNWKKMLMHIEGKVTIGLKDYRLGGHREVAPPHLPDVLLKEAQVASQDGGASGAGFFKVLLDNKNPFPVTVDKFSYTITIKDKQLQPASGTTNAENDTVPASAVAEYEATVDVNEAAFGKELKTILKSPSVPYVVEGEIEVRGIKKAFRFASDMKFAR